MTTHYRGTEIQATYALDPAIRFQPRGWKAAEITSVRIEIYLAGEEGYRDDEETDEPYAVVHLRGYVLTSTGARNRRTGVRMITGTRPGAPGWEIAEQAVRDAVARLDIPWDTITF
jgi:hypothetical protein